MSVVSIIMLAFAVLGALDRICGNKVGLGKEFEKGFNLLGPMALSMIGMITLAPLIADLLEPCFEGFYKLFNMDPSIIPASVFANDMGGDPLAREIMKDEKAGMLHALVTSSMMGCTISFTIPYALGVVQKEKYKELFLGMLCGIVTIPLGCFAAGLVIGIPVLTLLYNLLPLLLFSALLAVGLLLVPKVMVKLFSALGVFMRVIITAGLILGVFQDLTGIILVPQLASVWEGANICFRTAMTLCGAFPFMFVVSKLVKKPLSKLGGKIGLDAFSAFSLLSTLVTNATTLSSMEKMNKKGVVMNAAFAVSAAFVFGGHLALTMAFDPGYVLPMIVGKLISGIAALVLVQLIYKEKE